MFWKKVLSIVPATVLALGGPSPARGQAEIEVLVWNRSMTHTAKQAIFALGYTQQGVVNESGFIQMMQRQSWDLVVWDLPFAFISEPETTLQLLEDHIAGGGRALINYNFLDTWPELQEVLGVSVSQSIEVPEDVFPASPVHYVWYRANRINVQFVWYLDSGDELLSGPNSIVVGVFDGGAEAMVLGNDERTIVNGFDWDTYAGAGVMAHDQIEFLMECRADFDRSSGRGVLDILDFLRFQDLFIHQDSRANMCFDLSFDIFDFLAFQNAFVNGCA